MVDDWIVAFLLWPLGIGLGLIALVRARRRVKPQCPSCRYDLFGLERASRCPECGLSLTSAVVQWPVGTVRWTVRILFWAGALGLATLTLTLSSRADIKTFGEWASMRVHGRDASVRVERHSLRARTPAGERPFFTLAGAESRAGRFYLMYPFETLLDLRDDSGWRVARLRWKPGTPPSPRAQREFVEAFAALTRKGAPWVTEELLAGFMRANFDSADDPASLTLFFNRLERDVIIGAGGESGASLVLTPAPEEAFPTTGHEWLALTLTIAQPACFLFGVLGLAYAFERRNRPVTIPWPPPPGAPPRTDQ